MLHEQATSVAFNPSELAAITRAGGRRLRRRRLATTLAYGPRYLHSTGQLHKGGPNSGLFIQVVDEIEDELRIPGREFGFQALIQAQAAGDFAALEERDRRIVRIRLEELTR